MAVGDLQFNPSTGLASFNVATSKAQVREPPPTGCYLCSGGTPNQVLASFANISLLSCALNSDGEYVTTSFNAGLNLVGDGPWTLDNNFDSPNFGLLHFCGWGVSVANMIHAERYSDVGCLNLISEEDVNVEIVASVFNRSGVPSITGFTNTYGASFVLPWIIFLNSNDAPARDSPCCNKIDVHDERGGAQLMTTADV